MTPDTTPNRPPIVIAVVDDDEAVRDALTVLLETAGHRIHTFASGPALFEALDQVEVDVVLLDMRMPEIGGLELLEPLGRAAPDAGVVMITGHGDVPMAVRALHRGAVDFVEKPFSDTRILSAVERAAELAAGRRARRTRRDEARAILARLTPRETEVMSMVSRGLASKQIAGLLELSPRTVEIHRQHVMAKTGAGSVAELVRMVVRAELADPAQG
ncbi:MAG: response regulator transcription factor [Geminicoccaceae bacterium]|nr:response regulator transcription factor [Geminicoccaceae bacterium]